ncbi:hypothetical protein SAMN02745148_01282 [Modicisalibacter ilicicola DSM 19980]|uniref:PA2779 family protein n=1 Tax=Modicisalibacter ilicicola DSM 19980 TaxID=1121942 RepID=A0A1M4X198_9GAMM|nr:PA2779 family protein [Halomonas ilicicola]SHE87269.1 hypothetical protein SAMN02745148_01282 [Halomonas ilicicola DSM 19980]
MTYTFRRLLSPLLILALIVASVPVAMAQPQAPSPLVSTNAALAAEQAHADRQRINDILAREDVQEQLLAQGVDPVDVEARVAALSDEEVSQMADHLEEMPAGASSVVGALFAVFVILLVTDILGLTDVFPFTR